MIADFNKKGNNDHSDNNVFFIVGIIILIILAILIIADYRIYQKKQKMKSQIATYQEEIKDIKKSSKNLKEEIANSDNQEYLEKIAYEQLDQARPGETVYSFITTPTKQKPVQKPNFWDNFTGWISGTVGWIKSKI